MRVALLTLAATLLMLTMAVHSMLGHKRLIRPLLDIDCGVLAHPLARFLVPFAWHLTSGVATVLAVVLLAWAWAPQHAEAIGLGATAVVFVGCGIYDAFGSRGQHIGWPLLTAIGLTAAAAMAIG